MKHSLRPSIALVMLLVLSSCAQRADEPSEGTGEAVQEAAEASVETYQGVGVLKTFLPDGKHIRVEHEEIPGFMEAMTMSFAVEDTTLLQAVQVEDSIRFTLTVKGDDMYVSALDRVEPR